MCSTIASEVPIFTSGCDPHIWKRPSRAAWLSAFTRTQTVAAGAGARPHGKFCAGQMQQQLNFEEHAEKSHDNMQNILSSMIFNDRVSFVYGFWYA